MKTSMENYEAFKNSYYSLTHIDLNAYKEKQMKRRIETLIEKKGFDSYEKYAEKLASDKSELADFTDYITINVTEFFRKPEYWKFLEEKVIPALVEKAAASGEKLKIWSAGCSTGEEPYSLAMLLLKYLEPEKFSVLATDIDEKVLEKARHGVFSEKSMESFPPEYIDFKNKYFDEETVQKKSQKIFKIKPEVKNQIEFKKLDMTQEDFPADCSLIVCRNVLIYFTEDTKSRIFRKFHESLKNGGVLFLGHTEQIIYYKDYGFEKLEKNFYSRKA